MNRLLITVAAGLILAGCASQPEAKSASVDQDESKTFETNAAGEDVICRKDRATGSRLRVTKVCGTQAEWDLIDDANDEKMKSMTKTWTNRQ